MSVRTISVVAGLAPAIHRLKIGLMDARVKPARDGCACWQLLRNLILSEVV
jgi:hypothetical protein